jgi:hypothetical protein
MTNTASSQPLWPRARASFARAVAAVGDAASIALIDRLPRALRRAIVDWLYPLECIVRRLLFAEAAALRCTVREEHGPRLVQVQLRSLGLAQHAPPPWPGGLQTPPVAAIEEMWGSEDPRSKNPETWRAQFSFALPRQSNIVANGPRIRALWGPDAPTAPARTPREIKPQDAPFRLARRFEALRRVLENPRVYAERLARLLHCHARRIPRLIQRYMWQGARSDAFDPDDPRLSLDALAAAFDAPDAFKDTS